MDIQAYIQSGVIEHYVLGIASTEEIFELEQLRRAYPEIEAAVAHAEQWLSDMAQAQAVPVPPAVKEQLFNELRSEFTGASITTAARRSTISPVYKYVTAAAVVLLVFSAAFNVYLYTRYKKAMNDYTALQSERNSLFTENKIQQARFAAMYQHFQLMSDTNMMKVPLPGIRGKENNMVTLYWDMKSNDVYCFANSLPAAPAGKQYQLWALVNGKPVDAGMLNNCEDICKLKPVQSAQAFAITLEKAGGSAAPTLNQMVVFGNVRS